MDPDPDTTDCPGIEPRPQSRQIFAMLVIGGATALALGLTLHMKAMVGANDISRWCTVWSLLERGTYAIDDCPWQKDTMDKVRKPETSSFRLARPGSQGRAGGVEHFYSSKPPLLPTLIAGILYPFRAASGVPLDAFVPEEMVERYVFKEGSETPVLEKPKEPYRWAAAVFYFKPIVVLTNIVPLLVMLILFARLLDRYAVGDWAWSVSLFAAAWGTYLLSFDQTLNNHSVAAWSAFFALYALLNIYDTRGGAWSFAAAGFFGAFAACNEIPAALFGVLLFLILLVRDPRRTLLYFVPAAILPCAAFLATQYLAMGTFRLAYEDFGTKIYEFEGSYWNVPREFDRFNKHPEPYGVYLFHMTLGHHGVFSLTPIFLFSLYGIARAVRGRARGLAAVAWLTAGLTVAMFAFYTWNPKARNYGGSTQGLRWLFWLIPFWLVVLPAGLEPGRSRPWFRKLSLAAVLVSILSVGYALRNPWGHPWLLDALEHAGLYHLVR